MTTRVALLDVNLLVAFLWPLHIHHESARRWFETIARERGWATCPITELGCARVLALPSVSQGSLTIRSASDRVRSFVKTEGHEWWPDDVAFGDFLLDEAIRHTQGPNQLTDGYLLVLAAAHDGVLATLDRRIGAGLPSESTLLQHLEIVQA